MKIIDLLQDSNEWRNWRKTGITATDISIILGSNPYKKKGELWKEKNGFFSGKEKIFMNRAMIHGKENESLVRKKTEEKLDCSLENLCVQGEKCHYLASLDGFDQKKQILVEIKCPVSEKVLNPIVEDGIFPEYWIDQLKWQSSITRPKKSFFAVLDPRNNSFHFKEFFFEEKDFKKMQNEADKFWECVVVGSCPDSEKFGKELKDKDLTNILWEYNKIIEEEKTIAKKKSLIREEIIQKYSHHKNFYSGNFRFQSIPAKKVLDKKWMENDGIDLEKYYKEGSGEVSFKLSKIRV